MLLEYWYWYKILNNKNIKIPKIYYTIFENQKNIIYNDIKIK